MNYKIAKYMDYSEDSQFFLMPQVMSIMILFPLVAFDDVIIRSIRNIFQSLNFGVDIMITKTITILGVYLIVVALNKLSIYQLDTLTKESFSMIFIY
jgi:hypothetical protein